METEKVKCHSCGSENISIVRVVDEEDYVVEDLWDAHCKDCGWDFIVVDI